MPKYLIQKAAISVVLASIGFGQNDRAREIIRYLKYESPDRRGVVITRPCSEEVRDREAARSLVRLGGLAVSALEEALDSSSPGRPAMGEYWVATAYAELRGATALERLQSKADSFHGLYDDAIAVALGLTSYVSSSRPSGPAWDCGLGRGGPRDSLDQFILAWEKGDDSAFVATLGTVAKRTFTALRSRRRSDSFFGRLKPTANSSIAVGYKFETHAAWALPPRMTETKVVPDREDRESRKLLTAFRDRSGHECGRITLRFVASQGGGKSPAVADIVPPFLIDNSNLTAILRLLDSCTGIGSENN